MKLKRHRIEGVDWMPARWTGGSITPELVVIHDTASRLTKGNVEAYLADNDAKVSVHFVIALDGTVTQQVATNRRANHAGRSRYHGRKNANDFSIGIELVNPGRMRRVGNRAQAWFKKSFALTGAMLEDPAFGKPLLLPDIEEITTPEHGSGLWMDYPEPQLVALMRLLVALFDGIATLKDIRGHWYVSPGRKVDPNPHFPMDEVRSLILGREEPSEIELEDCVEDPTPKDDEVFSVTPGDRLNLRQWPSYNPNVIATIPDNTHLVILKKGIFDRETWFKVRYDGREGWINARFTSPLDRE